MNHPHPNVEHWARVQLVQGESGAATWDLSSAVPEARVTVGAGAQAAWNIACGGVSPIHFEFAWDGKSLWVGPISGTLRVDGETVTAWRQLVGRCRIEFGQAAMLVSTSASVSITPSLVQSQQKRSVPPPPPPIPDFQDSPATVVWQPSNQFEDELKTQMVSPDQSVDTEPPGRRASDTLPPAAPSGVARPGLGSQSISLDQASEFLQPMSTRILDVESLGLSPEPVAKPLIPMSTDVMRTDTNNSPFSLPPDGIAVSGKRDLSKVFEKLPPARTMALFGVTLIAGVVLVMMGNSSRATQQQQAEARATQEVAQMEAKAYADKLRLEAQAAADAKSKAEQAEADQIAKEAAAEVEAAKKVRDEARAVRVANGEVLDDATIAIEERKAADDAQAIAEGKATELIARHEYRKALPHYLYLSKRYPEASVYKSMVKIIRSRLACGDSGC